MKKTKYIIGVLTAALLLLALPARGGEFEAQSFLNVQAVYLTNHLNPTNLATASALGTNKVGTLFTNDNALVTVTATVGTRVNPFKDVALWVRNDGSPPFNIVPTNTLTTIPQSSDATVSVTWTAGSGANSAINFVVTPLYGSRKPNRSEEATVAGEQWTFAFTPTASARQTLSTNVPLWRWPGAKGLRMRYAYNADTDANGHVIMEECILNGYSP